MMKNKHDQGFSLVEILVAIVILVAFVVPTCSSLVLAAKMNAKTDDMMQAQLAVSSAVETLMAEGVSEELQNAILQHGTIKVITVESGNYSVKQYVLEDVRFSGVTVTLSEVKELVGAQYVLMPWYELKVTSKDETVEVITAVRKNVPVPEVTS